MTISEKFNIIRRACHHLKVCEVWLKHEPSPRVVQPIGICLTIKRGLIVVCKQTAGHDTKHSLPKTCNFALEDVLTIKILDKEFNIDREHKEAGDLCTEWLVHVSPGQLA